MGEKNHMQHIFDIAVFTGQYIDDELIFAIIIMLQERVIIGWEIGGVDEHVRKTIFYAYDTILE
jgi:hypothetical protein